MTAAGDLARLNLLYTDTIRSLIFENTFGFKALGGSATFANLASAFKTAVVKNTTGGIMYAPYQHLSTDRLTVTDVLPGTGAEVELDYTAVLGQNSASDPLPPQSACVITWRTGNSGKSFRGRSYMPGAAENDQSDGIWQSGYTARVQTFVTQLLAVFGPAGSDPNWQFVVISETSAGSPRVPKIGTPVTTGVVRPFVQTQRRRAN